MAITLRPYQAEAKEAILGEWAQGRKPLQKNNLQNRHEAEGAWGVCTAAASGR